MASGTHGVQHDLAIATQYFRAGQTGMAEAVLKSLVARGGSTPARAFELLAYIAGNRGDLPACEGLLLQATGRPDCSPETWFYLGRSQLERGDARAAMASFERAIAQAGDFFEALHELGVAHSRLGEHEAALRRWAAAARLQPNAPELHFNMGCSLDALHRFEQALASYEQALRLDARMVAAWSNRGVTLSQLARTAEALQSYDRALALQPGDVEVLMNKAATLSGTRRYEEALACLDELKRIAPDAEYVHGMALHARMHLCDWQGLESRWQELFERVRRGEKASTPFALAATPADPGVLLACARGFMGDKHPARVAVSGFAEAKDEGRIRIGYFSADFHEHATSQLMARMFECHDRTRFELFAFAFGKQVHDGMRERLVAAFDHFIEVSDLGDAEIAALARSRGIDIAVDLKGFTQDSRVDIFAHRAAPIQVNFLGFPGTMGCDYMDYIVADGTLILDDEAVHYSEKVVRLPHSYQPNDNTKRIAPQAGDRPSQGLPAQGFVFASFNNNYKITPDMFDVWMRLLGAVDGSVLWLLEGNATARNRLDDEARRRGIDPARIVWAARAPLDVHLARHAHADLFLDTLYCNAHTTCSDALWAGLPVLTLAGASFASRVAASLLQAVGLPELITRDLPGYEALALALARSPDRLAELRGRLAANRATSPLFDTPRFTLNLEAAYDAMQARRRQGLAPEHLRIADAGTSPTMPHH
ncbi:tetratricopeptide repeat protein [Variovorax sp. OV329]|uniref:O-linked N-acetylglucosamine transferase, SPINDLY family protein n=1 Tax=Variovorax sp. OV329 TaxID=1882825 RepID=UPI0008F3D5F1|nr:tetratricopeptide repeat protein [Variovorax sp. OV329]SFN31636.1 Predicted O-linked N-acetylglucosamine transferase, SPINDLY family [Variovorax sp. OV329]